MALLFVGLLVLAACAPHPGGDELAFLRGGQLWTINDDGSAAQAIVRGDVVGFAWSPTHQQLVLRAGHGAPAPTSRAAAPAAPGSLGVIGVDGGAVVTITPNVSGLAFGDACWNAQGNRLVYREGFPQAPGQEPTFVDYVLSQADQPAGIARHPILDATGTPAVAPDGSSVAVVDPQGNVRLGSPGVTGSILATGALLALPGGDRPARLLWQPGQQALLFARTDPSGGVALTLVDRHGHAHVVLTLGALLDYTFSPDGTQLLVQTPQAMEIWRLGQPTGSAPLLSWPEADAAPLAWWSPDGRYLLVRDMAGLTLVNVRARTVRQVLASASAAAPAQPTSWQPLGSSPWASDGQRIVFADPGTGVWLGHRLPAPQGTAGGLYVARIGSSGAPTLIASGAAAWPGWSALDPGASWLVPS